MLRPDLKQHIGCSGNMYSRILIFSIKSITDLRRNARSPPRSQRVNRIKESDVRHVACGLERLPALSSTFQGSSLLRFVISLNVPIS